MTATATSPSLSGESDCAHCGAPMVDDQEWCLECGTGRTLIHPPPDWRVPVAIIGGVVLLMLAAAVYGLVSLSSDANRSASSAVTAAQARATPPVPATTAAAATPATPTTAAATPATPTASFPNWPVGLGGWTVVLAASKDVAVADATATRLRAIGIPVGVLESNQHPHLSPGFWVVFAGRYPTSALAHTAAARLKASGQTQAHAKQVAPPGGQ